MNRGGYYLVMLITLAEYGILRVAGIRDNSLYLLVIMGLIFFFLGVFQPFFEKEEDEEVETEWIDCPEDK